MENTLVYNRAFARAIARRNMEAAGMKHLNKRTPSDKKDKRSMFAKTWREYARIGRA